MAWQDYPCILGRNVNPATGYSQTTIRVGDVTRSMGSHVLAYTLFIGPVPTNRQLDHLCRKRACIQPFHLEPVTAQLNLLRGETFAAYNLNKTQCPQGHTYDYADGKGRRGCKQCRAAASRRAYERRKEEKQLG